MGCAKAVELVNNNAAPKSFIFSIFILYFLIVYSIYVQVTLAPVQIQVDWMRYCVVFIYKVSTIRDNAPANIAHRKIRLNICPAKSLFRHTVVR